MSNAHHEQSGASSGGSAVAERGKRPRPPFSSEFKLAASLVGTAYVACLISGFGTFLDKVGTYDLRALPLYMYTALLLLNLHRQIIAETNHARDLNHKPHIPVSRTVYTWFIILVTLAYAVWAYFLNGPNNPVRFPATYIVLNSLALATFLYEFVKPVADDGMTGVRTATKDLDTAPTSQLQSTADEAGIMRVQRWAAQAGGLAAFCLLVSLILQVLATGLRLPLGIVMPSYVTVSIQGLGIPRLMYLQDLDLVIGLFAAFVSLALICLIAALGANKGVPAPYWHRLGLVLQVALRQGWYSFRFAISPLIWVVPAFSMALFSQQAAGYFRAAATARTGSVADFFNPFSPTSVKYLGVGLGDLLLALLAIGAVLVAIMAYEYDWSIIRQALSLVGAAVQIFVLLFPAFFLSLTVLNAGVVKVFGVPQPFQLITATIVTSIVALLYSGAARLIAGKSPFQLT